MMKTLLFVHGTGVRRDAFDATVALIEGEVAAEMPGVSVATCYWGEDFGARLHHRGKSIPTYDTTRGPDQPEDLDTEVAAWARLLEDPYFELRLMAGMEIEPGPRAPSAVTPGEELLAEVEEFLASPAVPPLPVGGWHAAFDTALRRLKGDREFQDLVTAIESRDEESERAVSRAIAASVMVRGGELRLPALDGEIRDGLVAVINEQIGRSRRAGILSRVADPLKGFATRWARKRRGRLADALLEEPIDILLYQARGAPIREFIRKTIDAAGDNVVLLGHSLGGIMCVDLLATEQVRGVKGLITVGSQAPFLYETGALVSRAPTESLPSDFPPWLNVYDRADFLSYVVTGVFPSTKFADYEVVSRQPFPESHSAYFSNVLMWRQIATFLRSLP